MFRQLFFPMVNYPQPTLPRSITAAVRVATKIGGGISALALEMEPPMGLGFANRTMPFVGTVISAEEEKARANKDAVAEDFENQCKAAGIPYRLDRQPAYRHDAPALFAEAARYCDLSILAAEDETSLERWYMEGIIFGSGRPCLLLPNGGASSSFDRIVVAWDGGRAAARAIADALPFLEQASETLVVQAGSAAPSAAKKSATGIVDYLARHNIRATSEWIEARDRTEAKAIAEFAVGRSADMIVMGAFGHSRLRDFILGGVTEEILAAPPLPVFLSY